MFSWSDSDVGVLNFSHWNDVARKIELDWAALQCFDLLPTATVTEPDHFISNSYSEEHHKEDSDDSIDHVEKEVSMVVVADALIQPTVETKIFRSFISLDFHYSRAVMIKLQYAFIAYRAVMRSWWFWNETFLADVYSIVSLISWWSARVCFRSHDVIE